MDTDQKNGKINNLRCSSMDCPELNELNNNNNNQVEEEEVEKESELNALLPPRKGGMSRKSEKLHRSVQWNDKIGNKLVEVLEFEPSDVSDSDDEDSDSCICNIISVRGSVTSVSKSLLQGRTEGPNNG